METPGREPAQACHHQPLDFFTPAEAHDYRDWVSRHNERYPYPATDPVMKAGQAIYRDQCSACHKLDGSGVADMFPALKAAPSVRASDPLSPIHVIMNRAKSASTEQAQTGYAWQLNDEQIAAV